MKNQRKIEVGSPMRFWIVLGWPWDAKWSILGAKTFKISSKWRPKSLQNPWKIEVASRMRFWTVLGRQMVRGRDAFGSLLATIFDQKSKKCHPKRHPKIDAEKVSKNDEKSIQNNAKMDAKINDFWYLFEKGEKPRNSLKTNRFLGFRHAKRYQKSIQIDAKSMQEKGMQKVWKMMPKCIQNGSQKPSKIWKIPEKRHPKIDAEIWCQKKSKSFANRTFSSILDRLFGRAGG